MTVEHTETSRSGSCEEAAIDGFDGAIRLDHAATTTLRPEARAAVLDAWDRGLGNAAGVHEASRQAKNLLEEARERAAAVLGIGRPLDVVFTSGGTESDNLAVRGVASARSGASIVVSAIEHKAVLEAARSMEASGFEVRLARPDGDGTVQPDAVVSLVDPGTAVVSVMAANNEIGTLQPVDRIVEAIRDRVGDVPVHTDAVQAFVGGSLDLAAMGVSLASLSAHKFGGPQGVGLLTASHTVPLLPIAFGGGHEAGRRPGTPNVAGVLGMVAAMEAAEADRERFASRVGGERDAFERTVRARVPDAVVTGAGSVRLPHVSHLRFPGVRAESMLIRLDRRGLQASAGSACQSGAIDVSHVLTAIGMGAVAAAECVRFSFGWDTSPGTGERAGRVVGEVVDAMVAR